MYIGLSWLLRVPSQGYHHFPYDDMLPVSKIRSSTFPPQISVATNDLMQGMQVWALGDERRMEESKKKPWEHQLTIPLGKL